MEKHFIKAEMRYQGPLHEDTHEVFVDIGSISVMEPTESGIRVQLSNAGGNYYVKDEITYTIDNVFDLYRRNVKNQYRKVK